MSWHWHGGVARVVYVTGRRSPPLALLPRHALCPRARGRALSFDSPRAHVRPLRPSGEGRRRSVPRDAAILSPSLEARGCRSFGSPRIRPLHLRCHGRRSSLLRYRAAVLPADRGAGMLLFGSQMVEFAEFGDAVRHTATIVTTGEPKVGHERARASCRARARPTQRGFGWGRRRGPSRGRSGGVTNTCGGYPPARRAEALRAADGGRPALRRRLALDARADHVPRAHQHGARDPRRGNRAAARHVSQRVVAFLAPRSLPPASRVGSPLASRRSRARRARHPRRGRDEGEPRSVLECRSERS